MIDIISKNKDYKKLNRERNNKQELLVCFLKLKLSEDDFNIAFDYIDSLEQTCNTIINLFKN